MSENSNYLQNTVAIVAAFVSNNQIKSTDVSNIITDTHRALLGLTSPVDAVPATAPARSANKRSVFPDYLICLEDGKHFKSLKRHLSSKYGLTPDEYRKKWSLPHDYPMVAKNYSEARASLAKGIGLGRKKSV